MIRPGRAKGPYVGNDGASGFAPIDAQYIVVTNDATLTQERYLAAGTGISLTDGGANGPMTVSNSAPESTTVTNVGAGTGTIYKTMVGTQINLKTLVAGSSISVTNGTDDITINNTAPESTTVTNVGTGTGTIYKTLVGSQINLKTIKAGTNITVTNGTDDITINATTGAPTNAQYVVLATNATLTQERVLTAGTGIQITDGGAGAAVTVSNSLPESTSVTNVGSGAGEIYKSMTGTQINLKKIAAGLSMTVTNGTDDVTVNLAAGTDLYYPRYTNTGALVTNDPIIRKINSGYGLYIGLQDIGVTNANGGILIDETENININAAATDGLNHWNIELNNFQRTDVTTKIHGSTLVFSVVSNYAIIHDSIPLHFGTDKDSKIVWNTANLIIEGSAGNAQGIIIRAIGTSSSDVVLQSSDEGSVRVRLPDAAGATGFTVEDSGTINVCSIDSNGNLYQDSAAYHNFGGEAVNGSWKIIRSGDNLVFQRRESGVFVTKLPIFANPYVALTDAATISVDASLGEIFTVTLGGNRTLGNPSNSRSGQKIIFRLKQDATGSRTITFDTKYRFSGDLPAPTLTTTAARFDYLGFIYNTADDKWDYIAEVKNFT